MVDNYLKLNDWLADLGGFELAYSRFANALWNVGRISNFLAEIRAGDFRNYTSSTREHGDQVRVCRL